jgi:hypothetical protein
MNDIEQNEAKRQFVLKRTQLSVTTHFEQILNGDKQKLLL